MLKAIITGLNKESWIKALYVNKQIRVFVVGGCVRDEFLGTPIKDVDLVVEGLTMDDIMKILKRFGKIQIVGQSFAAIKFRPKGHTGEDYDIVVPRKDRKVGAGHKGFEVITNGLMLDDDLQRRDFTINSIAVNIKNGEIADPFHGLDDMAKKILRCTDTAAFAEDALRILRGIQFAARFGFKVEPNTLKLMKDNAHLIDEIAGERIRDEFDKIIKKKGNTRIALELIAEAGLDEVLFGQKFPTNTNYKYFDKLDMASFYYVMCTLGGVNPSEFYRVNLKGEAHITKALVEMSKAFIHFITKEDSADLRWNVLMTLKASPVLIDAEVLPPNVLLIIADMKAGKIPMKLGDIPVTGNDLMDDFNVKDAQLGLLITKMYKDALVNKFNWKSKSATLRYLQNSIFNTNK